MTELIGKTLSHYKILGEISRGGMGVVYRAHDTTLKRDIAREYEAEKRRLSGLY